MKLLEMETALKIVASVANSRPLSARYGPKGGTDPDYLTPLTPNMLLTGRANTEIPVRDYDNTSNPLVRLEYVQRVVSEWWEQFKIQNFTSLVPTQRWQHERRSLRVGDVVLVQYSGKSSPGTYRLARVIRVEVDSVDGLVHTCVVMYSLLAELRQQDRYKYKGVTKKEIRVPVQRLVLILPVEEAEVKSVEVIGNQEEYDVIKFGDTDDNNTVVRGKRCRSKKEFGDRRASAFLSVRREQCRKFDEVTIGLVRADEVADSDPEAANQKLWQLCNYSK